MKSLAPAALAALLVSAPLLQALAQPAPKTQAEADAQAEAEEAAKRAQALKEERAKAPPPAIPGAEASGPVAPPDKLESAMSPNDALFDAINRGDEAAARDAINRGAQIDAHNVLGQTPIDASIDLNRTAITFLLLSMRGAVASDHVARAAPAPQLAATALPPARHHHLHAQTVAAAQMPRPLSQDRGTPNPQVGFIGY